MYTSRRISNFKTIHLRNNSSIILIILGIGIPLKPLPEIYENEVGILVYTLETSMFVATRRLRASRSTVG